MCPSKIIKSQPSQQLKTVLRKPHEYQERGVEWLLQHGGAALFADPGVGKTAITLKALHVLLKSKIGRRALIVAPLRVCHNVWPVEPKEWAGSLWGGVNDLHIVVLHGKDKDRLLQQEADVFVVNFEGFTGWLLKKHQSWLKSVDTLVIDESSKLRNTRTLRFRTLKPLLPQFKRRWILTGSPNPRSYMDLFGQCYAVDLGRALGRFVTHFRMQYFTPLDRNGWAWALRAGAAEAIQKAIAPYVFRLDAEDYLKMPKIVENVIRVELPRPVRKTYDELEEELITEIGRKVVTAASAGVASMKCNQVANGGLYYNPEDTDKFGRRTWVDLHWEKANAVKEIVDELQGSPCLVVYNYEHDLRRLEKTLEYDFHAPYHLGGDNTTKQDSELIAAWNRDELSVLLVHPLTVSHGLNLQGGAAQHIIWHSLTHDYEAYDQLIRRLRRQGSRHEVIFVHHIVATATVDEPMLRSLRKKEKTQTGFLDALKAYCEGRA
jgi:SNF2 family DNA or RNA helicase